MLVFPCPQPAGLQRDPLFELISANPLHLWGWIGVTELAGAGLIVAAVATPRL